MSNRQLENWIGPWAQEKCLVLWHWFGKWWVSERVKAVSLGDTNLVHQKRCPQRPLREEWRSQQETKQERWESQERPPQREEVFLDKRGAHLPGSKGHACNVWPSLCSFSILNNWLITMVSEVLEEPVRSRCWKGGAAPAILRNCKLCRQTWFSLGGRGNEKGRKGEWVFKEIGPKAGQALDPRATSTLK